MQIYCSALVFAPSRSLVRQRCVLEVPPWISSIPAVQEDWSGKVLSIETSPPVITDPSLLGMEQRRPEMLVFSPDGQTLALGSVLRGISFWDPTTGAPRGTITPPGSNDYVTMAFSPNGRFLAYMFVDHRRRLIGLWDVALQAVRSVNQDPGDLTIAILRFSPTSEFLAVCIDKEPLRLFETRTMTFRKLRTTYQLAGVSFSPSGRFLAVATWFFGILVEDTHEGKTVTLSYMSYAKSCGLFSPCDELLAYSLGHTIKFWRPDESGVPPDLEGHTVDIRGLVFSPSGRLLASLCSRKCSVWEVTSGARLYCVENADSSPVAPLILLDSRWLAWRTDDGTVSFWCVDSGNPHGSLKTSSSCTFMAFAPNSHLFACASASGVVDVWDVNKIAAISTGQDGLETVVATTTSSNSLFLASVSRVGLIRVWDMTRGDFSCVLKTDFYLTQSLEVSDHGSRLALSFESGTVKVLDIPGGKLSLTIRDKGHRFLAFSPDSQLAVVADAFQGLVVHDVGKGSRTNVANSSRRTLTAAFSPDGNVLAAASDGHIAIFSRSGWKLRRKIPFKSAHALALAPDNQLFASARKTSIEFFDLSKGGARVAVLDAPCEAKRLSFSGDGRQLVTELGALELPAKDAAMPPTREDAWLHFHIRGDWIVYDGRAILLLPPELRRLSGRAIHANTLAWGDEEGNVHCIPFDPAQMVSASGRPTERTSTGKWERPPKAKGLTGKCKRILGRIVGD